MQIDTANLKTRLMRAFRTAWHFDDALAEKLPMRRRERIALGQEIEQYSLRTLTDGPYSPWGLAQRTQLTLTNLAAQAFRALKDKPPEFRGPAFLASAEEVGRYVATNDPAELCERIGKLDWVRTHLIASDRMHEILKIVEPYAAELQKKLDSTHKEQKSEIVTDGGDAEPTPKVKVRKELSSEEREELVEQCNSALRVKNIIRWIIDPKEMKPYKATPENEHGWDRVRFFRRQNLPELYGLHDQRLNLTKAPGVTWDVPESVRGSLHEQRIRRAFESKPKMYQKMCAEMGLKIHMYERSTHIDPDAETTPGRGYNGGFLSEAGGYARPWDTSIYMPQTEQKKNKFYKVTDDKEHTFYHEIGHVLEKWLAGKSLPLSYHDNFKKAYEQDVQRIKTAGFGSEVQYFLSRSYGGTQDTKKAGRDEVFAEIFADFMMRKSGYSMLPHRDIGLYFPNTQKQMHKILQAAELEYMLFPDLDKGAMMARALPGVRAGKLRFDKPTVPFKL